MSASLSGEFNLQAFTDLGDPLIGGRLYTYTFGTTTHKTAYTDHAGTIPHTYTSDGLGGQYIALNARGELSAPLYLSGGSYDLSLKRADGSTVWTRRADPVWDITNDLSGNGGAALIGFTPAGTGAVVTTQAQVNEERVSGFRFFTPAQIAAVVSGAGTLDVSTPVQVAMSACKAAGRKLYWPAGKYLLNSSVGININNDPTTRGFAMEGEGQNTRFIVNHAGTGLELLCSPSFMQFKAKVSGIYFTDGAISPSRFIHNNGACNTVIEDCYFFDSTVSVGCVVNDNAYGLSLHGCVFSGIVGIGLLYAGTASMSTYSYVASIIDCDFSTLSQGIVTQGINALYVATTVFQECGTAVFADPVPNAVQAFNMTFDTCWFERNTTADLYLNSTSSYWCEATLRNCQFSGFEPTYTCHIELAAKSKITIDGCTAAGNNVIVSGSAGASALLIRATNFTQSGAFAWTELQGGGRFVSPYMLNNTSGDLKLLSGKFYSKDGTAAVPNTVTTALTTLPEVPFGTYIITISIVSGNANNWQTVGLINTQATSSVVTILRQSAQPLNLSTSGLTVQAFQNSGAGATVDWNIVRIA